MKVFIACLRPPSGTIFMAETDARTRCSNVVANSSISGSTTLALANCMPSVSGVVFSDVMTWCGGIDRPAVGFRM